MSEQELDYRELRIELPENGRLLAVLFSNSQCSSCESLLPRLERIALQCRALDIVEIDVSSNAVVGVTLDHTPAVYVVDSAGDLIRRWIGEPLAGTLERTVLNALRPEKLRSARFS